MPNFNCVEPAQENAANKHLVRVAAGDQITFPAVDSCFGVAFVLSDGRLVGGHVPTMWDDKTFTVELSRAKHGGGDIASQAQSAMMQGCLTRVVEEMNGLRGDATVALAITLGDTDWSQFWEGMSGKAGYPKEIRYRKNFGPRNLIVDGNGQNITVQSGGAGHYAAVAGAAKTFADGAKKPTDIQV
jgi:hypothetical protein